MNMKTTVTGIISVSILALLAGCKPKQPPQAERIVPVEIYIAKPDSISGSIKLTGGIEAQNDAFVYSKVSEKLVSLNVKAGDWVKSGQILGAQYNQSARQAKRVAEASLQSARIQLQAREDDFVRMENLLNKGAITRQQFDQARSAYDVAQASFEQASASVEQAQVGYENAVLRAPFSGRVAMVYFDVNQMVPAGQQVIKIVNANTVKAKLKVPATDIRHIKTDQPVVARFPSMPDTQFTGTVYRIDEAIDPLTRTLEVEVRLTNNGNILKSGMFGEFEIETARHTNTTVVGEMTVMSQIGIETDERGIQTERPEYYVFLVKGGRAARTPVTPGLVSGGLIELADGVNQGDSIIVAGQNIVKDGDSLKIVTKTES
ncbi:MAG: efflux RND transporter periplasmic adaptor subunit [Chitinispirillaceae bacterium]